MAMFGRLPPMLYWPIGLPKMNISSVIVIPHHERIEAVRVQLAQIAGVEVAAVSPEGKIIITIETGDDRETIQIYESISLMDGVMSASMVYHQKEDEPEVEISLAA
jgi:nitrate reductase NapD